jgi:outer membrane receptor protein involved in Fe transport
MPIRIAVGFLVAALSLSPPAVVGQQPVEIAFADPQPHFVAAWAPKKAREAERSAVLVRRVSLELADVSLDAALKQLTNQAGLNITYSPAVLPAGKRVTIKASDIAVVTALTEILFRSGLDVVVDRDGTLALVVCQHPAPRAEVLDSGTIVGRVTDKATGIPLAGATVVVEGTRLSATTTSDGQYHIPGVAEGTWTLRVRYIGYATSVATVIVGREGQARNDFELLRSVQRLDDVVTTGTVAPTEIRALPTPITVLTSEDIRELGLTRIDQLFRGAVPGSLAWDQSQSDHLSFVRVRGASSFSTANIKTFIDGVEVADPNYLATIDPHSVERIEITRGPQASTVYGANAISGVMQIFTKRGAAAEQRPQFTGRALLGAIDRAGGDGSALNQEYALAVSGQLSDVTYNLGGSYLRRGEWVPEYRSRVPSVFGGANLRQGAVSLDLSARYVSKNLGLGFAPTLRDAGYAYFQRPNNQEIDLRQQTYGAQLTYEPLARWTNVVTLGYDRSDQGLFTTRPRLVTPADTFLTVSALDQGKVSLSYASTMTGRISPSAGLVGTVGADHFFVDQTAYFTGDATRNEGTINGTNYFLSRDEYKNTGIYAQGRLDLWDQVALTAGVRADWNTTFGVDYGAAVSPRVGLAYGRPVPWGLIKIRGSYGQAIRPPRPGQQGAVLSSLDQQVANLTLGPEKQRGFDGGVDIVWGNALSLGVTYYDQKAFDLIDRVLIPGLGPPAAFQNQNVGRVRNRGWELEAMVAANIFRIRATYSFTSSMVEQLTPGYTGDLQVGDHLLGIPRHTAGAAVTLTPSQQTSITSALTYVGEWTNSDFVALYGFFFAGNPYRGSGRAYWITYPSFAKVDVTLTQRVLPNVQALVRGENLTNSKKFEFSNVNTPIPRVVSAGVEVIF